MWNLYQNEKFLEPLRFSNGKTQDDVTNEVLNSIKKGNKVVFIHGMCGTGKSAIALNISRKLGKSSIVVPGKSLQTQYKKDYEENKYLLKDNNEKLKISVITGRNNHKCKFLDENKKAIPKIKKEVNSKLHDIFEIKRERAEEEIERDSSADNSELPCKIEIKEKNFRKIKEYIKQNKDVNPNNFHTIKDVKRVSVAKVCPYWSPVLPEMYEIKSLEKSERKNYLGLNNTKFTFYQRERGCKYYEQFNSFIDSDVIVFNSLKYKLESAINRKPSTEVEIIDECDEFLDSFSNQRNINVDRLQNSLTQIFDFDDKVEKIINDLNSVIKDIKNDKKILETAYFKNKEIIPIKETKIYDLLKIFLDSPEFLNEIDEESYLFDVENTAKMFEDFFDETYLTANKKDNNLTVSIVTTNLAKRFKEIVDKNKVVVLMSGTLHSKEVLKNIFGLDSFEVIEAETKQQGKIDVHRTGLEMDCKYENFSNGKYSRENYLRALSKCVEMAKRPSLIHVNSFADLPSEKELEEFDIDNLISNERLKEIQNEDKIGDLINKFKKGQIDVLFSTKCARGIDFPGEECNSIIFTKYPNPNVQDSFWKILKKTNPDNYWNFYRDKARRELLQKIYRGLRFEKDHIYLLSPDTRVLDGFY